MKTIIHSNAPWANTGYGGQTAQLAQRLADDGHDVAISAFYGLQGAMLGWADPKGRSYPVYGCHLHPYGDDIILGHATHHFGGQLRDGLIIALIDCWIYNPAQFTRANVAWWVPVDHDPVPPKVVEFLQVSGAKPVAMSRFGEAALAAAGLEPAYAPHGIDVNVFAPRDRQVSRAMLGLHEDAFVVGMVAANKGNGPSRKGFSQALEAFARFRARQHPNAILYLHTEATGVVQGVNLLNLATNLGVADAVVFCDQYRYAVGGYTQEYMAHAYSAMDVLLNPALGEGFGVPIVEAQACGTPVITTRWTSMPELTRAGTSVDGDRLWSEQQSWWKIASVQGIADALEEAASLDETSRRDTSAAAREFAVGYDAATVFDEHWRPVLAEMQERMGPLPEPAVVVT